MSNTALETQALTASSEFYQDVVDWFSGKRAGHLSKWLYSTPQFPGDKACGVDAWAKVAEESTQGSPYYVFRDEEAVIRQAAPLVSNLIKDRTRLIDLGPGSIDALQNKVFPVMRAAGDKISEYVAVDVSEKSLKMARENVTVAFPDLRVATINRDFINERFGYGSQSECEVGVFFGLTLCNLPIDPRVVGLPEMMLTASLERLKTHYVAPDSYLVVTIDTNQDIKSLRDAYFTRKPVYETLLYRIQRDLNIDDGFDPDGFNLDIEFIQSTHACSMYFIAKHDMSFMIDDQRFFIQEGQKLYFHNAFKFDQRAFIGAADQAGLECLFAVEQPDNPCVAYLLGVV